MNKPDELITTVIEGRQVTYYLTSTEDLNNLKSDSLIRDIFTIGTSIAIGGMISVILTKASAIELQKETITILNILLCVFIAVTLIFGSLTAWFYCRTYKAIKMIKQSGKLKSFQSDEQLAEVGKRMVYSKQISPQVKVLEIIKATYWTSKVKLDITEELREKVVNNKLDVIASNDIKGDPHIDVVKNLTIEYRFAEITLSKEYTEGERIVLP